MQKYWRKGLYEILWLTPSNNWSVNGGILRKSKTIVTFSTRAGDLCFFLLAKPYTKYIEITSFRLLVSLCACGCADLSLSGVLTVHMQIDFEHFNILKKGYDFWRLNFPTSIGIYIAMCLTLDVLFLQWWCFRIVF